MADVTISGTAEINSVRLKEQASDPTNEAGYWHTYVKSGGLYAIAPDGTVVGPFTATGAAFTQGARVYHDANQSLTNNVDTALAFNSERYDTDTIHDTVTNNTRLTCQTAGKYLIVGNVSFDKVTGGRRILGIRINAGNKIAQVESASVADSTAFPKLIVTTIWDMGASDYVELMAYQNSGSPVNILVSADISPEFMMQRIG